MLAMLHAGAGDVAMSETLLRGSIADDPTIAEGWWRLAYIYYVTGDIDAAKSVIEESFEAGIEYSKNQQELIDTVVASPSVDIELEEI